MAIAYDASSGGAASATSLTYSHVVGSGSNRYIVVGVYTGNGGDKTVSCTYDGNAMTELKSGFVNSWRVGIWGYANPTSGTKNIVVSVSGGATSIHSESISLTGVDATQPGASGTAGSGVGTSNSITFTTLSANSWLVDIEGINESKTLTPGAGQTGRRTQTELSITSSMSTKPTTTTGSYTMSYSTGSASQFSGAAVELKEYIPPAVNPQTIRGHGIQH